MQRSLKSGLLTLLGTGALIGCSLLLCGCKKEERDAVQVSQNVWDKLDGKNTENKETSKIEEQPDANFLKSQIVFDSYQEGEAISIQKIRNRPKINILGHPLSMSFFYNKFNHNPIESSCSLNFCKSDCNNPLEIDYTQSQSYLVISEPVTEFKKAPTSDNKLTPYNKLEDKKLAKRLLSIVSKEPKFGKKFDPKKSQIYKISEKEEEKYRSTAGFSSREILSIEKGLGGFTQFTPSSEGITEGIYTALVCDFKFIDKNTSKTAEVTGCVTMQRTLPVFEEAIGYWLKNSDSTIIGMNYGSLDYYIRNNSSERYNHEKFTYAEYDSKKDLIYLWEGKKLPALGRDKVRGEVFLYYINENGVKETMSRTSIR